MQTIWWCSLGMWTPYLVFGRHEETASHHFRLHQFDMFELSIRIVYNDGQFTLQLDISNSFNFLGLTINRMQHKLSFDIYRKPACTVIHKQSASAWKIQCSSFHSTANRLLTLTLSKDNFSKTLNIIKTVLRIRTETL